MLLYRTSHADLVPSMVTLRQSAMHDILPQYLLYILGKLFALLTETIPLTSNEVDVIWEHLGICK